MYDPGSAHASRHGWMLWLLAGLLFFAGAALAQQSPASVAVAPAAAPPAASTTSLDEDVQALRREVVDLNRELFMLEEELLFPANTQVAVFLSMDVGTFFALDSVQIKVGGKEVANHLYTSREVDALVRGGVQRLWLGNLKVGKHEIIAIFSGKGPHGRDYRRGATLSLEKGVGARYVELRISDSTRKLQPEFIVKEWE